MKKVLSEITSQYNEQVHEPMNLIVQISSKGHDFVKENRRTMVVIPKVHFKICGSWATRFRIKKIPDMGRVLFERGCSRLVSHELKYSSNRFQSVFLDISIICSLDGSTQYIRHMKLSRLRMVNLVQLVLNA